MFLFVLQVFLIVKITASLNYVHESQQTLGQQIHLSNKVRNHVLFEQQQQQVVENSEQSPSATWLANSNKLGLGYNPVTGDPVCYTGACQMAGFGRAVFKFNYTNSPSGSCTTKLIPENSEVSVTYYY